MTDEQKMLALLNSMDETATIREHFVRVPIGYPGSKDKSLPELLPLLPYANGYCEVFGGSGAVMLARNESQLDVYNDRFGGITCFYRVLKDRAKLERLVDLIELSVHSREEFVWCKDTWYTQDVTDDVDRAYRWVYMNQNSFAKKSNAFGRDLRRGQQGKAFRNLPSNFWNVHNRLRNVQIENLDWRVCLRDYDQPGMVHYLDPTYLGVTRGVYKHELSVADHIEMCERVHKLEGFVAISGYDNELTRSVYDRFKWDAVHTWEVAGKMAGFAFSDTNNLSGHENNIERAVCKEILFVKDFS